MAYKKQGRSRLCIREARGIVPVEVKMSGSNALGRSFYSFIGTYKLEKALVITLDELSKKVVNDTTVYSVPIFYL